MWPGEQPPAGGPHSQQPPVGDQPNPQQPTAGDQPNPYQQPGLGHPNPYQQPGFGQPTPYQQPGFDRPNPYQQPQPQPQLQPQPQPWNAPTQPGGGATPPPSGGGRNRTGLVAVIAAAAVVLAAGVTGFLMLGGTKHGGAGPGPTGTASPQRSTGNPRSGDLTAATVKGWKVVTNPSEGIAFDVPPQWEVQSPDWVTWVSDDKDPDDKPLVAMRAPAFSQKKWCSSDEDRDGRVEDTPLAAAGTKGNNGARNTQEIARTDSKEWVYGQYAQPDRAKVRTGTVEPFVTASGLKGSLGSAWSVGAKTTKKCSTDGKAWTFGFKDTEGNFVSWSFFGAKNVPQEVPDATVRKIAATIRLYKAPSDS